MSGLAPMLARLFLREHLCTTHYPASRDDAELLISELITSAVMHGGGPILVRLDSQPGDELMIDVSDTDGSPLTLKSMTLLGDRGRGLTMVEVMASRWGVTNTPRGRTVWFTLPAA